MKSRLPTQLPFYIEQTIVAELFESNRRHQLERTHILVRDSAGAEIEATTFTVKPAERRRGLWTSANYVRHIVHGLRANGVPDPYIKRVIDIAIEANGLASTVAEEQTCEIADLRNASQQGS